jgi:chorismate dehydratase
MPIEVARIPNLECEAFYFDMERRGIRLHDLEPNEVAPALEAGETDTGPVSLVDSFKLAEGFTPVTGFCVASVSRAGCSVLFSKKPIEALGDGPIALDDSDATSICLLQVLLALKHQCRAGAFVKPEEDHDALLLTGNPALRQRRGVRGYPYRYDLGEEWREWTGLPFVFRRWVARSGMDRQDLVVLEDALFVGQEDWINNLYKATGPRDDLRMLPREVLEYIQGLRFFIGVPEERSIALFREYLASLESAGD